MNSVAGAVPPNDLDAEGAVLAAAMLKQEAVDAIICTGLESSHFYNRDHARIWSAVVELAQAGQPVDLVQVASRLRARGEIKAVGGPEYLAKLVDETPAVRNVEAYATTVIQKARLRRAIDEAHRLAAEGYGAQDAEAFLESAAATFAGLAEAGSKTESLVSVAEAIHATITEIGELAEGTREVACIRTGLDALDRVCPLREAQLTVLAAGPGIGKTSLALQISASAAKAGDGVLFVSLEMPRNQLTRRLMAQCGGVDGSKLADPRRLTYEDWQRMTAAGSGLGGSPLWIDDRPDASPLTISSAVRRAKARATKAGLKLALVVVDYLQLVSGRTAGRDANREQQVSHVARELKVLANRESVHVMALAQLNHDAEKGERRPRMSDLRESKAVGMHADNVWLLNNPSALERSSRGLGGREEAAGEQVELIVDKQRAGSAGHLLLWFYPSHTRFALGDRGVR